MNKILCASVAVLLLASCAKSYHVTGSTSVSALDGSKLHLKAVKAGELKNIDSCDVVHGEFHFAGLLDTVRMVNLFMDDESIMPVILEEGEITMKISAAGPTVGGTPLNDSLYSFIDKHNQLTNQMNELGHRQNQMILEGVDEQTISEQLNTEAARITAEEDELVTKFIEENFDNALGPGVFMLMTSQYRYPVLTPQIEYLMSKATKTFKEDPYVKEYYQMAQENEKRLNGLSETAVPASSAPAPAAAAQPAAMTPDMDSLPQPASAPLTNVPQP